MVLLIVACGRCCGYWLCLDPFVMCYGIYCRVDLTQRPWTSCTLSSVAALAQLVALATFSRMLRLLATWCWKLHCKNLTLLRTLYKGVLAAVRLSYI